MGVVNKLTCDGPKCPRCAEIRDPLYPMLAAAGWICAKINCDTRGNARLAMAMPDRAYYFCSIRCMSLYFQGIYGLA